ncbi:MAG: hypothetical protein H0V76_10870 [Blastocatellia bacterium]|nr:hypothetical protein [Blastocatellia bacterium]
MIYKFFLLAGVLSVGIGCSSSASTMTETNDVNRAGVAVPATDQLAANPDAPITDGAAPDLQSNGAQTGEVVMMPDGTMPPPLPEGVEPTGPTQIETKLERLNKLRAAATKPGNGPLPKPVPMEAPENSYVTAQLTDVAIETRVFRNHATLSKIERIHDGKNPVIKVYLKNGNVVTLPGDQIESISQAPSGVILKAAGVQVGRDNTEGKRKPAAE